MFSSSCVAKSLKPHSVFFTQCWPRGYTRKVWSSRDRASSLSSFRRHLPCGRLYDRHTVDGIDRFFTWCLWISTRARLSFPSTSCLLLADNKWKTASNNKEKSHQNSRNNSHHPNVTKYDPPHNCNWNPNEIRRVFNRFTIPTFERKQTKTDATTSCQNLLSAG